MISSFIETPNIRQTFCGNKDEENPDKIMVRANITTDNQIVFSLALNRVIKTQAEHYLRSKKNLEFRN